MQPDYVAREGEPRCGFGTSDMTGCILPAGHLGLHVYNLAPGVGDYYQHFTVPPPPKTPETPETVDHPAHYNQHPAGIECIAVVEAFNFNIGNAIKYLWRAGLKPGTSAAEDLQKAAWYIQREIERRATEAGG